MKNSLLILVISLLFLHLGTFGQAVVNIKNITEVNASKEICSFKVVDDNNHLQTIISSKPEVSTVMFTAFLTQAHNFNIDLVNDRVLRVEPFKKGDTICSSGTYSIDRIATQTRKGEQDIIEVFLLDRNNQPLSQSYIIKDPALKQLVELIFIRGNRFFGKITFDVEVNDSEIEKIILKCNS